MESDFKANVSRLAVAQAVCNALKKQLDSHGGEHGTPNMRTEVDDAMRELFDTKETYQVACVVNDRKVGTVSVRASDPSDKVVYDVTDPEALAAWLASEDGMPHLVALCRTGGADIAAKAVESTGELPDGVDARTVKGSRRFLGTTVRVDVKKVAAALGEGLPQAVAGILTDGGAELEGGGE